MIKDFYKRFNLEAPLIDAQTRFMNRIDLTALHYFKKNHCFWEPAYLQWLSIEVGEDFTKHIFKNYDNNGSHIDYNFGFKKICNANFNSYLLILESIHKYLKFKFSSLERIKEIAYLDSTITDALDRSEIDLGIFWKDGKFYPAGSKLLDNKLIVDSLDWLAGFPDEKKDFEKSLKAHLEKRYSDAIGDCYNCVEGLARKILNNRKVLDSNKEELIAKLKFSQEWKSLISNFIKYANEYKRHASESRHKVDPDEVEAFIYLTGLLIRLQIKKK